MSQNSSCEIARVGEVVGGLGDKVFIPGFRGEGDEGEVPGNVEILLGHPRDERERMPGSGGDDGGRRMGKPKGAVHRAGDMFGAAFFDDGNDGIRILLLIESLAQAAFGGFQSGEVGVGHEESDAVVTVAFEESAGMEGGGFPVFIDKGDLNVGLGVASDESRNGMLVEPLLHGAGALIENPGVRLGVFDESFEFSGGVFEMEKSGRDELEFVAALVEEFAEGVEFYEHPGRELGEVFWGKEGNAFGGGFLAGSDGENFSALSVFAGRDDFVGFEDFKGCTESVPSDLELGCQGSLSGKSVADVTLGDHFLNDLGSLNREGLAVRDSRHALR